jgi:hypothetical protein
MKDFTLKGRVLSILNAPEGSSFARHKLSLASAIINEMKVIYEL